MSLFMLHATPDLPRLLRWAEGRHLLHRRGDDDLGYALHALLAAAFGALAPAPFALLRDPAQPARLLAYAGHPGAALRAHALAFAEPDALAALGLETLADKPMPERFAAGTRLGFTLRACPTVRTDRAGDRARSQERDAFLAAIEGTPQGAGPARGEVYAQWLAARIHAAGAEIERQTLEGFRLVPVLRRDRARALRPMRWPDARFGGVLRVTDPDRFAQLLARGVGRQRSFGFGMLLLRPPC